MKRFLNQNTQSNDLLENTLCRGNSMRKNKRLIPLFLLLLVLLPNVYALDVGDSFANIWEYFWGWMQNAYIVYGFTFILFMILLYAACAAALSKVKVFQGDGPDGLSKSGKVVALSIGALCTLGIFFFTERYGGPEEILENVLAPFGIFGGLILALVVFSTVYFGFQSNDGSKSWKIGLGAAAVAMIVAGMVTSSPNIMSIGWTMGLIVAIFALIGGLRSGGESSGDREGSGGGGRGDEDDSGGGGRGDREDNERSSDRLDYNNPGHFRVHVVDLDNQPVRGARVYVGPESTGVKGLFGSRKKDVYFGRTGPKGFSPHISSPPAVTGSGRIRIRVDAKDAPLLAVLNRGRFTASTSSLLSSAHTQENPLVVSISLDIKQQRAESFFPRIHNASISDTNLMLEGEVV